MQFVNTYWIFFCVVSYTTAAEENNADGVMVYNDAQVWRTDLRGPKDIILIKKLIDLQAISMWNVSPKRADFLVLPENSMQVQEHLASRRLQYTVMMDNVQQSIYSQKKDSNLWNEQTLRIGHRLNFKSYPSMQIIDEYYNFLAEEYSSICRLHVIGRTFENRTITMINITNGNPNNEVILITGGIHGREWVAITSALYILHTIVTHFDQQMPHMKSKNWLIIPVVNPDGYEFTHTNNRLWRKNRRRFTVCAGADINRNFEQDWSIPGIVENSECREAYGGPFPVSEVESYALRDLISNAKKPVGAIVDLHSYGNTILYPWSARSTKTQDVQLHEYATYSMAKAIKNQTSSEYRHGPTYHMIYPATGTLIDWAYSQGIKHSYAIETRDDGSYGFLLLSDDIEKAGKEMYAAVYALAKILEPAAQSRSEDPESWF